LYSSNSRLVVACLASASSHRCLRMSISPCTTTLAWAASSSRVSLSFVDDDLEDPTCLMPRLLRNSYELVWDSDLVTTLMLDTGVSPSSTGCALKFSIAAWMCNKY
jgi:hypothetical protein